jgi:hypothetical protein
MNTSLETKQAGSWEVTLIFKSSERSL